MKYLPRLTKTVIALGLIANTQADVQWKLKWADEFDQGTMPDPKVWSYEVGMVRNEEAQVYTKSRSENARIENGCLVIEARRENIANPHYQEGGAKWNQKWPHATFSSASLTTKESLSWKYGRIEVRAKMPKGKGTWPAIWMLGVDTKSVGWPACGELDLIEYLGKDPKVLNANVHYQLDGKHRSSHKRQIIEVDPSDDFHVYALEWTEEKMDFYFDQTKYHTFLFKKAKQAESTFHQPFYILLNLAMGGNWGGAIDPSLASAKYLIDYVRVYEK